VKVGDRARCATCGAKIALIPHPRIIALDRGLWVHVGALRRLTAQHPAVGPTG
jgi:hypothetical protein